jgi:hypothetical protein
MKLYIVNVDIAVPDPLGQKDSAEANKWWKPCLDFVITHGVRLVITYGVTFAGNHGFPINHECSSS